MVRVLVVEDNADKLRRVVTCLLSVTGLTRDAIDDARDANTAKRMLREGSYDLLILDISLPTYADEMPTPGAGLNLLRELQERDVYRLPAQIVGLTGLQDALEEARPHFDSEALQLVPFDVASRSWEDKLRRIAGRVVQASRARAPSIGHGVHLCVVTALASPELEAVLDLPWNWTIRPDADDPTTYHQGTVQVRGDKLEVVAAAASRMGMQASAVLAAKMSMTFRPRYLAMTGIMAGIRGQCELGDVIAADPTWDYQSGKRTLRNGLPAFSSSPHQIALDPFVRGKLARMAQDSTALDRIRRGWRGQVGNTLLRMHVGPVASGAAVLEDPAEVERIRLQHRKTLGVEMETYGVYVAAQECPAPQPRCFSLKSACDFADTLKNDDHQAYAAYTSASALRFFVEEHL